MYQTLHEKLEVQSYVLSSSEKFPNNPRLPLLIYRQFFDLSDEDDGEKLIKETLTMNGWGNTWCDGIYDFHHYHSTTHEVLGVASGTAVVNFGGTGGVIVQLTHGDVVIIPAGVAHKCLKNDSHFKCVGGYPESRQYDMNYGRPGERPLADRNIEKLPIPLTDPVFGNAGPMFKFWKK